MMNSLSRCFNAFHGLYQQEKKQCAPKIVYWTMVKVADQLASDIAAGYETACKALVLHLESSAYLPCPYVRSSGYLITIAVNSSELELF